MDDLYNGTMLRRWSLDLVTGRQECAEDAVDTGLISAEDRAAVEAKNAAIHAAIDSVEAYEAALLVAMPDEPHTQPVYDDAGNEVGTEPTPAYAAWTAAQVTIGETPDTIKALARLRAGEAGKEDTDLVAATWDYQVVVTVGPQGYAVNTERELRIAAGATVDITGLGPVPVQGRDTDIRNLQGLGMAALARMMTGDHSTITSFRDANNNMHDMVPDQVFQLWQLAAKYAQDCYAASWAIKAMTPIPADFANDGYWPAK